MELVLKKCYIVIIWSLYCEVIQQTTEVEMGTSWRMVSLQSWLILRFPHSGPLCYLLTQIDSQFHNFGQKTNMSWRDPDWLYAGSGTFIVPWLMCRLRIGGEETISKNTLGHDVSGKQWVKKLIRVDRPGEWREAVLQQALDEQLNKVETDPIIPYREASVSNKLDWTLPVTHSPLEYVASMDL